MVLEIYDCTLREGEQAEGASFSLEDRITLCKLLDEFGVDYIELGWPVTNGEIKKSFEIAQKEVKRAKIVAFGSTSIHPEPAQDRNLNSILETGVNYACIFGKTDKQHIENQLRITPLENLEKIYSSIKFLRDNGLIVFYDAEHFYDAYKKDSSYAIETLVKAIEAGAERIVLCDTNGGSLPDEVKKITEETENILKSKGLETILSVHFHNDCNLALANTLATLHYIGQVQGTINGIGERIGNLNFSEFLPVYMIKLQNKLNVNLRNLKELNEDSFRLCGVSMPEKRAFVGDSAFAHSGGVHIDAEGKGASYTHMNPELVGNKSRIVLNSGGGRSAVIQVAKRFGYELQKQDLEVRTRVDEMFNGLSKYEKKGYRLGLLEAEQYLLLDKYFGANKKLFELKEWKIESASDLKGNEVSTFYGIFDLNGELKNQSLIINGGIVDVAFNTFKKVLREKYPQVNSLHLTNFDTGIARWSEEKSSVRTKISFRNGERFSTVGVDENMIGASMEALEKGFRYHLLKDGCGSTF